MIADFLSWRALALVALLTAGCKEDPPPDPTDQATASSGSSGKGSTSSSGGGTTSSSSSTSSSGNTTTTGEPLPTEVTVTAPRPAGLKVTRAESADKKQLGSLLTVKGKPTLTPTPPGGAFPSLVDGKVEIVSPPPAACTPQMSFTYNATEVAVVINGVDEVAKNTDCSKFTDAVVKSGLHVIVTDAPWSNVPEGTTAKPKVTVKFE